MKRMSDHPLFLINIIMKLTTYLNENRNTLILWHGGKGLEDTYRDVKVQKRGRWEFGPGLYLTNKYTVAERYAKGSRKLYKVTITKGNDIEDVQVPYDVVEKFINSYVLTKKRSQILADIKHNMERMNKKTIGADIVNNLIVNHEALKSSNTSAYRQWLIDQGVDYSKQNAFGSTMYVVFNPRVILGVQPMKRSEIIDDFELEGDF